MAFAMRSASTSRCPALVTLAVVVAVWIPAPRVLPLVVDSASDTFTALATPISALAFAGVV